MESRKTIHSVWLIENDSLYVFELLFGIQQHLFHTSIELKRFFVSFFSIFSAFYLSLSHKIFSFFPFFDIILAQFINMKTKPSCSTLIYYPDAIYLSPIAIHYYYNSDIILICHTEKTTYGKLNIYLVHKLMLASRKTKHVLT